MKLLSLARAAAFGLAVLSTHAAMGACIEEGGYPFGVNGAANSCLPFPLLNAAEEMNPGPTPPVNSNGAGAGQGKFWLDTSTTPNTVRQCAVARCTGGVYHGAEWNTWGTIDATNQVFVPSPYGVAEALLGGVVTNAMLQNPSFSIGVNAFPLGSTTTAPQFRTDIGLAIGADVEAWNANLDAAAIGTGGINPLLGAYGAPSNGTSDASSALASACTAAASAGVPVLVDIKYSIQTKTNFAQCAWAFGRGGSLATPSGIVATLNGSIEAGPLQQIFTNPGAPVSPGGTVTNGSAQITSISSTTGIVTGALISGPFIPPWTYVGSIGSGTVNMVDASGSPVDATGSVAGVTLSFQPVTVIANAPRVSAGWWGLGTGPTFDNGPALRAVAGSYRTITIPPGIWTVRSATASPYPPVTGIGDTTNVDWNGLSNVAIDAAGGTITTTASVSNTDQITLRNGDHITRLPDLHLAAYEVPFSGWISGTTLTYPLGTDIANGVAITGSTTLSGTYVNGNPSCSSACTVTVNNSQTVGSMGSPASLTAGLPCCEPGGLSIINISDSDIGPLWWVGNWGGSTKSPAGIGLIFARDTFFHGLHMPLMSLCVDGGMMLRTHWFDFDAIGANDSGSTSAPSRTNCFNAERDGATLGYYPGLATAAGFSATSDNTLGPSFHAQGFAAGAFLRAGNKWHILADLSLNPGAAYGASAAGHTLGAGLYNLFEAQGGVATFDNPVTDVTLNGSIFKGNGTSGTSAAGACGSSTGVGAGLVNDTSCAAVAATAMQATTAATASGTTLNFGSLALPGWVYDAISHGLTVTVTDTTTVGAIPGGTTLSAVNLFTGAATLSASVTGVLLGDVIEFSTTGYEAANVGVTAISNVNTTGIIADNNVGDGIESFNPSSSLSGIGIGVNTYSGASQTTRIDSTTLAALSDANWQSWGGAGLLPTFGSQLTWYLCHFNESNTSNFCYAPEPRAGVLKNLSVYVNSGPGGSYTETYTVLKNGTITAMTCTITGSATSCSDTTDVVTFVANDTLQLKLVSSSNSAAAPAVSYSAQKATP